MHLIPILKKSHLPSYLEETGYTCMHTCRRWERPKDATSMLPKWASLAQQEIHRAAGRAETRCQGLFIQNNALAVDWLFCQHFSLLTLRLLKSSLAPFFISISTSLSLPLSLLPLPGWMCSGSLAVKPSLGHWQLSKVASWWWPVIGAG